MPNANRAPLLTRTEVAERLNVAKSTTYQLRDLPPPVRLARQVVRWQADDIEQYIVKRRGGK